MTPLSITILHDGVPGHLNQSRGLSNMIASRHDVDVRECHAQLKRPILRRLLRKACQSESPLIYKHVLQAYDIEDWGSPDILIAFGGNVAPLNATLRKQLQCHSIQIGSLRSISPGHFSAHLSLAGGSYPNMIATGIAPTRVSPRHCRDSALQLPSSNDSDKRPAWACVIGGDGSGYRFLQQDWITLAGQLNRIAEEQNIRWIIATSRRTGEDTDALLAKEMLPRHVAHWALFSQSGATDISELLGASEQVLCTADSLTMLSETISSGLPVLAISPEGAKPVDSHRRALDGFERQNFLRTATIPTMARADHWQSARPLDYDGFCQAILNPLQSFGIFTKPDH